jgi:hypothetical protein
VKSNFAFFLLPLALAGCATNHATVRTEERSTNGTVVIRTSEVITRASWPATSELTRQKVSNGKTQSIGTDGLSQEGGGTNVVDALRSLDSILGKIR